MLKAINQISRFELFRRLNKLTEPALKCVNTVSHRLGLSARRFLGAVLAVCVVATVAGISSTEASALDVKLDGRTVGRVANEQVLNDALQSINGKLINTNIDTAPVISTQSASTKDNAISAFDEAEGKLVSSGAAYVYSCGIFVDQAIVAYADSQQQAAEILDAMLGKFNDNDTVVEFVGSVEAKYGLYLSSTIAKLPHLNAVCEDSDNYTCFDYTVKSGDTLDKLTARFGVSAELIRTVNLQSDFSVGSTINMVAKLPKICVRSTTVSTKTTTSGYRVTEKSVKTVSVNGIEVSSEVVSSNSKLVLPQKRKKFVGSKGFCWPVDPDSNNYISSFPGDGRGHKGWDIAARTGTAILAPKGGRVVGINNAGSGYGLNITIDHGNGLRSLYAHCNDIFVSLGDRVEQGDVIASVGSTGRSTGPHLHLQFFKNGNDVNPSNYLSY